MEKKQLHTDQMKDLDIKSISTLSMSEDDVLVISVDTDNYSRSSAQKYMEHVRSVFREKVKGHVVVIPSEIKLTKIQMTGKDNEINSKKST